MIQLVITMDEQGRVTVTGPIENRVLCYGLLESARDAIKDFRPSTILSAPASAAEKLRAL